MTPIQQAKLVLNGIGGTGFDTILCRSLDALVGNRGGESFVQQADRQPNGIRHSIFGNHVDAPVDAGLREGYSAN